MPFVDLARIYVEGGHGGAGCVSFRREAHTPRGGPDGGNGGPGGAVVLVADERMKDLSRYRHAVHHRAPGGGAGEGRKRHGRAGGSLELGVPPGTRVRRDGERIAALDESGARAEVARGGRGGVGNRAFRSSTHRAPRESVPGTPGEGAWLTLELRLPIDVALVGLPNSGKSTLLNALTGAGATVAAFPHSTKEPAFGPLEDEAGHLFLVADLPGLAADGNPRAGSHLEQLERARVIVHCLDATDPEPAGARLERARDALGRFVSPQAHELIVATRVDEAAAPPEGDLAVGNDGQGVAAVRDAILALLCRG